MKVLHYGLQRSGTNFLETLLKRKYRIQFLNSNQDRKSPLQKHFRLYDDKEKFLNLNTKMKLKFLILIILKIYYKSYQIII